MKLSKTYDKGVENTHDHNYHCNHMEINARYCKIIERLKLCFKQLTNAAYPDSEL